MQAMLPEGFPFFSYCSHIDLYNVTNVSSANHLYTFLYNWTETWLVSSTKSKDFQDKREYAQLCAFEFQCQTVGWKAQALLIS